MTSRYDVDAAIKRVLLEYRAGAMIAASLAALAFAAPAGAQQTSTAAAAPPAGQMAQLQEVVVTAEKRKEPLQSVPISVAVFTPKQLQTDRILTVADIASYAPNVYVVAQTGGNSIPQYTIRGVAAGNSEPQLDNPVTLYLDGVPIGREVGSMFDLGDIQRIEVLRGPQGTLFGRNSTGGAVSVITTDPSGQFGVRQDFTAGNYAQFLSRTTLDTATWHGFSAELTYLHNQRNGDIRNLGGGTTWSFAKASGGALGSVTAANTLGGEDTDAFRVALQWQPFDGLKADYKYDWTSSAQYPPGTAALTDPDHLIALGGGTLGGTSRPDAVNDWFSSPNDMLIEGHNLTTEYDATPWLKIKDILGYRDYWNHSTNQIDGAGGLHDPYGLFGAVPGSPLLLVGVASRSHFQQVSDELQFNLTFKPVEITSGLVYFKENLSEPNFDTAQTIVVSDAPDFVIPGSPVPASHQHNKSKAIYSQATFYLDPELDLVLGGRETYDDRDDHEPFYDVSSNYVANHFTYLTGLDYKPAEGVLLYTKYSTGYVPGGRVGVYTFAAETLRQAELGEKSEFLDHKLRLNAATFYSWYYNQQLPSFVDGVLDVVNASRARISGFELEATAIPLEGLEISGNLGYTDFAYIDAGSAADLLLTGSATGVVHPNYRPRWTGTTSVDYQFPALAWGGQPSAHVDAEYRSWYDTQATGVFPSPSTILVNARLQLANVPLGGLHGEISLWGKNLTNRNEIVYASNLGVSIAALYQAARTFGIDVSLRY